MHRVLLASLAAFAVSGCVSATTQPASDATPYADFLIGRYAERSRDPVVAAQRYAAALRNSPRNAMLLQGAANSALAAGDAEAAASFGRQARGRGIEVSSGRLAAAAFALRAGRADEALRDLDDFEGPPTELLAARLLSVWSHVEDGEVDVALAELGGDSLPPSSPWAALQYYERAMVLDHAGRTQEALQAYEQGDGVGGLRIAQIIAHHGQLLERVGRKADAVTLYQGFLEDVDNPGIVAELKRLSGSQPVSDPFPAARGAAVALFTLSVLIAQDPTSREQLGPLSLAMALDPSLEAPRIAFADAMLALNKGDTARRVLTAISRSSPYFESAQSQIARSLHAEARDDEAVATLKTLVDHGGGRVSRRALADLYRNLDRNAEAAALYASLVAQLDPPAQRDWRLYFAQGATLERLGRWPAAEAALQQALVVSPDRPEVLNYLGYTWVDTGEKVREGLALLERAVAQAPDEGYIIDSLGWAHFRLGNFGQAVEYLERAVELSPGDSTLNDHLGDAYWRVGRRIEARYQWRRVLTLEAPEVERVTAEKKIVEGLPAPVR